ncbi:MAG: hypothetical protein CL816_04140 [Coxiellaceae bacterium]|nr:hypothetical protein [Coxiellaceae bacterium]
MFKYMPKDDLLRESERSAKLATLESQLSQENKELLDQVETLKHANLSNINNTLARITDLKIEILQTEKETDLLPTEKKAVLAGMNAIIRYINESNANLFYQALFMWTLTDQNDFSSTMHRVYQDAYKKEYNSQNAKIERFINHLQKNYPVFNRIIIMNNKKEVVEKLFYNLSKLFTLLNENIGDNALVTTKLAEIEKDLMNLLNDRFIEEPIPFKNAVIKKAIEQCIEKWKEQPNMSPAPDFNSFISKFLYPLTEHEFKKVKHEIQSKIIQKHDKIIHRLYGEKHEYFETEEAVEERIFNDLLSHHLGRFDVNIAKSIYLEQVNPDGNSNLQSLTYSHAAIITKIITDLNPFCDEVVISNVKKISMKMIRSEVITKEDIHSLVDSLSMSGIHKLNTTVTWSNVFSQPTTTENNSLNIAENILLSLNQQFNPGDNSTKTTIESFLDEVENSSRTASASSL